MKGKTIGIIAVIVVIAIVAVVSITMFYKPATETVGGEAYFVMAKNFTVLEKNKDYSFIGTDGVTYRLGGIMKNAFCTETDAGANSKVASNITVRGTSEGTVTFNDSCMGYTLLELACGKNIDLSKRPNRDSAMSLMKDFKQYSDLKYAEIDFNNSALLMVADLAVGGGFSIEKAGSCSGLCIIPPLKIVTRTPTIVGTCDNGAVTWQGGWVAVQSAGPLQGDVFIDGQRKGSTVKDQYVTFPVTLGARTVTISKAGYKNYTKIVTIDGGETETVVTTLQR